MSSMADHRDNTPLEEEANDRSGNILSDPNTFPGVPVDPMENRNVEEDPMLEMVSTMDALRKELADQRQRHTDLSNTIVAANTKLSNENASLRMQVQSSGSNVFRPRRPEQLEEVRVHLDMNDTDMITPLETHGPPVHQTQTENDAPRVQILEPHVPVGL